MKSGFTGTPSTVSENLHLPTACVVFVSSSQPWVLGDRTHFVVEDEQWKRFVELLDRPPQENPGLTKPFAKPSIFQ